jgi:hypothetical protein
VTFYDGSTALGTETLNSSGVAMLTTSSLGLGTHSIQAVFDSGATLTANFAGSTSTSITQTINPIAAFAAQPLVSEESAPSLSLESDALVVSQRQALEMVLANPSANWWRSD